MNDNSIHITPLSGHRCSMGKVKNIGAMYRIYPAYIPLMSRLYIGAEYRRLTWGLRAG